MIIETEKNEAVKNFWISVVENLDFAFQPIVGIHSGSVFGYEALLRNTAQAGFHSIDEVFNQAYEEKAIYYLDLLLRKKAIRKFSTFRNRNVKLFYNIDSRVIDMPDFATGNTNAMLEEFGLNPACIVFELSEKHEFKSYHLTKSILDIYKFQKYNIAIDDYGTGYSGLQLLYHSEPDIIKLDKFFIRNIHRDIKKRLFVGNITEIAHTMGIKVVAEGVEKEEELAAIREAGCDYIQGFFIEKPIMLPDKAKQTYSIPSAYDQNEIRESDLIQEQLEYLLPVYSGSGMETVYNLFKNYKNHAFFPLLNENNEPLGIIREKEIRNFIYTNYGKELVLRFSLEEFTTRVPIQEVSVSIHQLVRTYSMNDQAEGIIITENGQYLGFLSARSLLKIIDEKKQEKEKNTNRITKLPSASRITRYVMEEIQNVQRDSFLIYLDISHFKSFNEFSGFKRGDAVISLLAELIRQEDAFNTETIGHFGGDDFFIGVHEWKSEIHKALENIRKKFSALADHLYQDDEMNNAVKYYRNGNGRIMHKEKMEILIGILELPKEAKLSQNPEEILHLRKDMMHKASLNDEKTFKIRL